MRGDDRRSLAQRRACLPRAAVVWFAWH